MIISKDKVPETSTTSVSFDACQQMSSLPWEGSLTEATTPHQPKFVE